MPEYYIPEGLDMRFKRHQSLICIWQTLGVQCEPRKPWAHQQTANGRRPSTYNQRGHQHWCEMVYLVCRMHVSHTVIVFGPEKPY